MQDLNLLDETFDKNQTLHYNLSIQVDLHGLTFCMLDTVRNKYTGLRHYALDGLTDWRDVSALSKILETDDILKLQFKNTCFMIVDGKNTLVPLEYFDNNQIAEIFTLNHTLDNSSEILYNSLAHALAANIFSMPIQVKSAFKHVFPDIKAFNSISPFIENLIHESGRSYRKKCFVSIHSNTIDIGIASQKTLEFFNTFAYREKSDIVYFILSVMEKFELPVLTSEIHFSSDMESNENIYEFLGQYINHIKFIRPGEHFSFSYIFDDAYITRFANLFNLALCVS